MSLYNSKSYLSAKSPFKGPFRLSHFMETFNTEAVLLVFQNHNILTVDENLPYNLDKIRSVDLSSNVITSLKGLSQFTQLRTLNMSNNQITSLNELGHLKDLKLLTSLNLKNNPISELPSYRLTLLTVLPNLSVLDGYKISAAEIKENKRLTKYSTAKLEVLYNNYLKFIELQSLLKRLETHNEYLLRLDPAIVNPPFDLLKFQNNFSYGETLDEDAKQVIKNDLLADVTTLQTEILKCQRIEDAFEEMERKQIEKIKELEAAVAKKVQAYKYNCLDVEIYHKISAKDPKIKALKAVVNSAQKPSASQNKANNKGTEDEMRKTVQDGAVTEESLRGSFGDGQTFTEKDLKRLANLNNNRSSGTSELGVGSGIEVSTMTDEEKLMLIEKLAVSLKKYIGKAKEYQRNYEQSAQDANEKQGVLTQREEELRGFISFQESVQEKLQKYGVESVDACLETLKEAVEQIELFKQHFGELQSEETNLEKAISHYDARVAKKVFDEFFFMAKRRQVAKMYLRKKHKYETLKTQKIFLAQWKQYHIVNKIVKQRANEISTRNYVMAFEVLKRHAKQSKAIRQFTELRQLELMDKALRGFFVSRVIRKRESEDESKATGFRNLVLQRRGFISIFAHHLQHSERRDERHEQKVELAVDFANTQVQLRVFNGLKERMDEVYRKRKVMAELFSRVSRAMKKATFRSLRRDVAHEQRLENKADKFYARKQFVKLIKAFNVWRLDFHAWFSRRMQLQKRAKVNRFRKMWSAFSLAVQLGRENRIRNAILERRRQASLKKTGLKSLRLSLEMAHWEKFISRKAERFCNVQIVRRALKELRVYALQSLEEKRIERNVKKIILQRFMVRASVLVVKRKQQVPAVQRVLAIKNKQREIVLKLWMRKWLTQAKKETKQLKVLQFYENKTTEQTQLKVFLQLRQNQADKLKWRLFSSQQRREELEQEVAAMRNEIEGRQRALVQSEQLCEEWRHEAMISKEQIAEQDARIEQLLRQNAELIEYNEQLVGVNAKREANYEALERHLAQVKAQFEGQVDGLNELVGRFEVERSESQVERVQFLEEIGSLKSDLEREQIKTEKRKIEFDEDISALKEQITTFERIIADYSRMTEQLTLKNQELDKENVNLCLGVQAHQERMNSMQQEEIARSSRLEDQLNVLTRDRAELSVQNEKLNARNDDLEREVNELRVNMKKYAYQVDLLKEEDNHRTTEFIARAQRVAKQAEDTNYNSNSSILKANESRIQFRLNTTDDQQLQSHHINNPPIGESRSQYHRPAMRVQLPEEQKSILKPPVLITPTNATRMPSDERLRFKQSGGVIDTYSSSNRTIRTEASPLRDFLTSMKQRTQAFIRTIDMQEKKQQQLKYMNE